MAHLLFPDRLLRNTTPGIAVNKIDQPAAVIQCQENTQTVSQFFIVKPGIEVFFFGYQFGNQQGNNKYTKGNNKRPEKMIPEACVNITFVKTNQRFGDAAARAGETRKHFKRTKRLAAFQVVIGIIQ